MNPFLPGLVLIGLVSLERLAELFVSRSNQAWSLARGGFERGQGHWPAMVALHTALLIGCAGEPFLWGAPAPWPLFLAMTALVVVTQTLRVWCILSLGRRWNARVVVTPGLPLVARGPYRFLRHPNYVIVVTEGIALPLATGAWVTALLFTLLDAWLLSVRIPCEEAALQEALRREAQAPAAPVSQGR